MYPSLNINLSKLAYNTSIISEIFVANNLKLMAVTKAFCGDCIIADTLVANGAEYLADSRIENLAKLKNIPIPKLLLRLPMKSEIESVISFADYSLNSELETIYMLSEAAVNQDKVHNIILMLDLGDLREGILPKDIYSLIPKILNLPLIKLSGIGVNLTCYGGVIPDEINLGELADIATRLEQDFNISLEIISGGNSSSFYLIESGKLPSKINSLRLGESILLGRETAYGNNILNLYNDAFILNCQIVELKEKGSKPKGKIGMDAFGNIPTFEDRGILSRAILAIGRQDVSPDDLTPIDKDIEVLGASSDHLILNLSNCKTKYKLGDVIEFSLNYGSILSLFTSPYVKKQYIK